MASPAGCIHHNRHVPEVRGHRVAEWVRSYIAQSGCTSTEVAFRIGADKRDLERLLRDETCGARLEDRLACHFGWPFIEAVFSPLIETNIEAEIAREREQRSPHARNGSPGFIAPVKGLSRIAGRWLRKRGLGLHRIGAALELWGLNEL